MLERLIKLLGEAEVSDYRIVEVTEVSHQAFFVKQSLDQHRISNVTHMTLEVYMDSEEDGQKLRGKGSREIYQGESDEQLKADIETLKFNASLAMNPYYEIVKNEKYFEEKKDYNLTEVFDNVVKAMQNVRNTETEKVNSYEVFVTEYYYHIVNSKGVDLSFNTMDEEVEIVINSIDGDHEIEVYHNEKFADKPMVEITAGIQKIFEYAKDRTQAKPTRKMMGVNVLMSGKDNADFFEYFLYKTNTQSVFYGNSQVKIGDNCQESDDCDKVTLKLAGYLPHSSRNMPYSKEGNKALDLTIVDNGVYQNYWGDQTTAYYLGLEKATPFNNYVVEPGSRTVAEMKQEPYLEIIQFSSFLMSPVSGDFGGEIRLGYYYDGQTVTPVTGGSITCNMNTALKHIYFSKETKQYDSCIVPQTIQLFDVNVAGEE